MGLFGSFLFSLLAGAFIWFSHIAFRYSGHPDPSKALSKDPFSPLSDILILPGGAFVIIVIIGLFSPSLRTAIPLGPFLYSTYVFFVPIILFWSLRIFKMRPQNKEISVLRVLIIIINFSLLAVCIWVLIRYYPLFVKLYELLPSARNSRFVFILLCSSALPSFAHLLAITAAIIAKATPKPLQQLINRHLKATHINDEKILNQLGNGLGGLGALITAIIQLI